MALLDLGLLDGEAFSAVHVDALEFAINQYIICTSSTRPTGANLYEGVCIYETNTNRKLMYDGTGWIILSEPMQTFTPAYGGVTEAGATTNNGYYKRSDGWCHFSTHFTCNTTNITGAVVLTLPIAAGVGTNCSMFRGVCNDNSGGSYPGFISDTGLSPTTVELKVMFATSTYAQPAAISSVAPFSWGAGDSFYMSGHYPMVTRYS